MKSAARRSRHGKTAHEKAVDSALERVVRHPAGMSLADAHNAAKQMPGRLLMTERRGDVVVSVFAS